MLRPSVADELRRTRRGRVLKAPEPVSPVARNSRGAVSAARWLSPASAVFSSAFLRAFLSSP